MDIFGWIFKNKEAGFWIPEKHLPQVSDLRKSIKQEIGLFHEVWKAHEEKAKIVRDFLQGDKGRRESAARELPKKNWQIADSLARILDLGSG